MGYEIGIIVLKSFQLQKKNLKTKQVAIKTTMIKNDTKTK